MRGLLAALLLIAPVAAAQTPPGPPPAVPVAPPVSPPTQTPDEPGSPESPRPDDAPADRPQGPSEAPDVPENARFRAQLGGSIGTGYVLHAALGYPALFSFGPVALGGRISAEVFGDLGAAGTAELLITVPFETLTLYAGPGLGIARGGAFGSLVVGASVPAFGSLAVYAEAALRLPFGAAPSVGARVGLLYAF